MESSEGIERMSQAGQTIILGVTGGIAAYKAAELCRMLAATGASVQVVMTEAAQQFVTPLTFQALSGKPVLTSMWMPQAGNGMDHIALSRQAQYLLVAPASADFLAKLAHGRADDLLSTLCLARTCPLVVAPAMNREMWANPATIRNLATLQADGIEVLGPASGAQACGETGPGRMLEPAELLAMLPQRSQSLAGKHVLVTAGPTFEAIDPVRGLTNLSSGKMGYAVARAAHEAGATVSLVSGPVCLQTPAGVRRIDVQSAVEMRAAVLAALPADVFIGVAAVADYRPETVAADKLKKAAAPRVLTLLPNPDILAEVAALPTPPFCVGFAAETTQLADYAEAKRRAKRVPLLVGNLAQVTLGQDAAELILFDDRGQHPLPRADKLTQARRLIQHVIPLLN